MFFNFVQLEPFLQILLAAILGSLIGLERRYRKKEAGFRTLSLISLGSCLFVVVAANLASGAKVFPEFVRVDLGSVIQAIAVGVGFIGSGIIILQKTQVEGLTTAAALWASAAIGVVVGFKFYFLAIIATFLVILILAGFRLIEEKIFPHEKQ